MSDKISKLINNLTTNPPLKSYTLLQENELKLGIIFPTEYAEFMTLHNGAEGQIGTNSYIVLWALEELVPLNIAYNVATFAPELLLFGSDGGGTAFAFDKRDNRAPIVEVPFIGMSINQAKLRGQTFYEFLENLYSQP